MSDHEKIEEALRIIGHHCIYNTTWVCGVTPTWKIKFEVAQKPSPKLTIKGLKLSKI